MNGAPRAIRNRLGQGWVELDWGEEGTRQLTYGTLRAACPCSACRAGRLAGRLALVAAEVRITAVISQGYGVQLVFSDGHDRGIYPWAYLRGL